MSLDFHPNKDDLICSCDGDGEIRYWSINNGGCARVFKGGTAQVRFQPRLGRYLAAAAEHVVSIFDVETQTCRHSLEEISSLLHGALHPMQWGVIPTALGVVHIIKYNTCTISNAVGTISQCIGVIHHGVGKNNPWLTLLLGLESVLIGAYKAYSFFLLGSFLENFWRLPVRTLLVGAKGNVFMSSVMVTNSIHVSSIPHTLRCWSLAVTRISSSGT